jgi:hypothetical protein
MTLAARGGAQGKNNDELTHLQKKKHVVLQLILHT